MSYMCFSPASYRWLCFLYDISPFKVLLCRPWRAYLGRLFFLLFRSVFMFDLAPIRRFVSLWWATMLCHFGTFSFRLILSHLLSMLTAHFRFVRSLLLSVSRTLSIVTTKLPLLIRTGYYFAIFAISCTCRVTIVSTLFERVRCPYL